MSKRQYDIKKCNNGKTTLHRLLSFPAKFSSAFYLPYSHINMNVFRKTIQQTSAGTTSNLTTRNVLEADRGATQRTPP